MDSNENYYYILMPSNQFTISFLHPTIFILLISLGLFLTSITLLTYDRVPNNFRTKEHRFTEDLYFFKGHTFKDSLPPYIISAYEFDDHLVAVIPFLKPMGYRVYCRYFDIDRNELKQYSISQISPLFVVYCPKRKDAQYLGITDTKDLKMGDDFKMPLQKLKAESHDLTHCVAPVFGKEPKWLQFVELIEHYKLQGVTKMFFYVRELSKYDLKILEHYEKEKFIEIITLPSIFIDVISQQLLGVADCHLRSQAYSSRWTIFSDIDERLIMTADGTSIDDFLLSVEDPAVGSVLFRQRYIFKKRPLPEKYLNEWQVRDELPITNWHETSAPANNCKGQSNCWGKHVIRPDKVIQMLVHDVSEFKPGFKQMDLSPDDGYVRHYRDVYMENWGKKNMKLLQSFGSFTNTTYPFASGQKLVYNVLKVLQMVYT